MISSLFLCHGGPTLVVEKNEYTNFLKDLGKKLNPKAIVIFTAHWESEITTISSLDSTYDMIYDFYGFPKELYSIKYPAQGSVDVASKLQSMLRDHGIESKLDENRGLDHGAWDVLYLMFPKADIPVIQVSVNPELSMEKQYEIGEAIRELGKEDILVIGSGSTVHNLSTVDWNSEKAEEWAVEFDNWLIEKVENNDREVLFNYRQLAPYAKLAVPREEHIVPMFIAMGSGNNHNPKLLHQSYVYGTLSYICFEF
ncbi:dioxygenase [Clostridium sp. CX1]|uniref:Class III extradiol ring-cleavage dioxygenase n=1 Tax=Clostridium tanneri TaxID=3037988 RepID=A0ABU4JVD0_9CLOT|nr:MULTISPECIES: class III extradiol ring-cleavage dioxygenase [unclassified Clostridium]MCT8975254.1 dioxygenase [Clostridium sp. CX1]MDW8802108.1 class III extradiol ring-cleavage dioxygenase [Clostridium sp. A1-XYC3]